MHYKIFQKIPCSHYINVELNIKHYNENTLLLKLPRWRPGRYEMGNFSKNIRNFKAYDNTGNELLVTKINTFLWEIFNTKNTSVKITYEYYANEYNAGACFANEDILYINPVHLFMDIQLTEHTETVKYLIDIQVPKSYKTISSLSKRGKYFVPKDFDELVDSPIVASPYIKSISYSVNDVKFFAHCIDVTEHYWDSKKITQDFITLSKQVCAFWKSAPIDKYHFIIHLLPQHYYHGVEHLKSTVIVLGPSKDIMTSLYSELLGVSSHELFHAWNIKSIRPVQMQPYNYYTENYSELGFVYEGFTTYYGDKLLWQSGLFSDAQFLDCINERLNRHYINDGKLSQSILDSSIDTWVDGYGIGAPHKKVSIYDEGCLLALLMDLRIIEKSKYKKSLRDLCLFLYQDYVHDNKAYSINDIVNYYVELTKEDDIDFFGKHIFKAVDLIPSLSLQLEKFGLKIYYTESIHLWEKYFGFKVTEQSGKYFVTHILPSSPAYSQLSLNDEILIVDNLTAKEFFTNNTLKNNILHLKVYRFGKVKDIAINASKQKSYYQKLSINKKDKVSASEKKLFNLLQQL